MKFDILTLFPEMFGGPFGASIIRRACDAGFVEICCHNIRDYATDRHSTTDDAPYGGGAGMVLRVDVVAGAIKDIKEKDRGKVKVVLLTPQGQVFDQHTAQELASGGDDLILVCGHYEGFDERIRDYVDLELSIGDYVLTGGQRCFFVADNGKLRGMLTLRDITHVPKPKWRFTTAEQAMIPLQRLVHVNPNTEILAAMQTMDDANVNQVPVLSDGEELVGMLSREQVVHYLRTRSELGI